MPVPKSDPAPPLAAQPVSGGSHRLRRWAPAAMVVVAIYWLTMFAGTHHPNPPSMPTKHFDKVLHFSGFGGLAVLLAVTASLRRPMTLGQYLAVFSCIAVYAALDEITQMLVPNRSCEFLDWCADMTGATLGLLFAAIVISFLRRHWHWRKATA